MIGDICWFVRAVRGRALDFNGDSLLMLSGGVCATHTAQRSSDARYPTLPVISNIVIVPYCCQRPGDEYQSYLPTTISPPTYHACHSLPACARARGARWRWARHLLIRLRLMEQHGARARVFPNHTPTTATTHTTFLPTCWRRARARAARARARQRARARVQTRHARGSSNAHAARARARMALVVNDMDIVVSWFAARACAR